MRKTTAYGVTSERVIVVSTFPGRTVKSVTLRSLSDISLAEQPDGSGTIMRGPPMNYAWSRQSIPVLEGIRQARSVYETIREAQKHAA